MLTRAYVLLWRAAAGTLRPSGRRNLRRLSEAGLSLNDLRIRDASPADLRALASLHVITWNATYGPLLRRGPSVPAREKQWRDAFARDDPDWFCLIVERPDGHLVGFAQGGRSDHPEYAGQLGKIYLRREYQGLGLGRRLIGHVARRFLSRSISSMWLFGDARNPSARAWIAMGAEKTDPEPRTGNFGWKDIQPLADFPE